MQLSLKSAIAAILLAVASTSAMATVVTPPTSGTTPSPGSGNGGLIVTIADAVRGVSLVQYLGLTLNDVLPTANGMTTPGTVLDFGTLSAFNSVFGASSASNIQYSVVAADSLGSGNSGKQLAVTFSGESDTWFAINNTAVSGAANSVASFIDTKCAGAVTCIAMDSSQNQYAGGAFVTNLGQLAVASAGAIGSVLHFAYAGISTGVPSGAAPQQLYASNGTFGEWLLNSSGQLTYSLAGGSTAPVPLPAAVWLLFSGLAGLGAIGRRKNAA